MARAAKMVDAYEKAVATVAAIKDNQAYGDLMARRLVEMAGNTIMTYLLITDASRYESESLAKSAIVYCNLAEAEVAKHAEFIATFKLSDLDSYKA